MPRLARTRERIVSVDEQDRIVRKAGNVGPKGVDLPIEGRDKRVRHGADDRDAIFPSCHNVAGSGAAGEIAGARHFHAGVHSVGAPQGKVDHRTSAGSMYTAGGFGGDQGLQVKLINDESLDDLRLDDRRGELQKRLIFEKYFPFGNCPDVPGETKLAEIA